MWEGEDEVGVLEAVGNRLESLSLFCPWSDLSLSQATFLKLAGPQLVQMFIGDGAKLVRDAFALAKEKAPSIIFIDELDAIGTKR